MMVRSGMSPGRCITFIVRCSSFQRPALAFLFYLMVSTSSHLGFSFKICGFGLFENIDEMLALVLGSA